MKEVNVMDAPHHAAVHSDVVRNQKKTGARPKYVDNMTTTIPPAPNIKRFPTNE